MAPKNIAMNDSFGAIEHTARLLQDTFDLKPSSNAMSALGIMYLVVVSLCFAIPIIYCIRITILDFRQLRRRDTDLAAAIEISLMSNYQHRESSGEARAARKKYREQKLARVRQHFGPVEMILSECNFHDDSRCDDLRELQSELDPIKAYDALEGKCFDNEDEEGSKFVKIPIQGTQLSNKTRLVPSQCIICLSEYKIGDKIVWSSNELCEHAFHSTCMETWLMQQRGQPLCPCCRLDFIIDPLDNQVASCTSQENSLLEEIDDEFAV